MKRETPVQVAPKAAVALSENATGHFKFALLAVGLILLVSTAYATQIRLTNLADLPESSEVIALAKVVDVTKKTEEQDEVTIKIASLLKGDPRQETLTILLTTRVSSRKPGLAIGEVFLDPTLKVGDMGVFFLNVNGADAKLSARRSIAHFQKEYFYVPEE